MVRETLRFLICATLFALCLFGAAALLTGCDTTRHLAEYCFKNPDHCEP